MNAYKQLLDDPKFGMYETRADNLYRNYGANVDRELVMLKVAFIDSSNSTNLRMGKKSLADWADKIVDLDFDLRVQRFDSSLVRELAAFDPDRFNLSFASKYCTYHNYHTYERDDYSIFDRVVRKHLPKYLHEFDIHRTQAELRDYECYYESIGLLIERAQLNVTNPRRRIDHFIWWNHRGRTP